MLSYINGAKYISMTNDPINGEVNTFADLPAAASHADEVYLVLQSSGIWLINRKSGGLYHSDGATWSIIIDYDTLVSQIAAKQPNIQFKDEGVAAGSAGQAVNVDFVGAGVSAAYASGTLTVTVPGGGGGGLSDGDYGDITLSSSASVWTIDNDAVDFNKVQNISTNKLLGRGTAGSGNVEEITLGTNLSLSGTTLNATGGGGGGGNSVTATLSFGSAFTDKAQTVITGQSWVATNSEITTQVLTPSGVDPDEIYLLNFKPIISDLVAGDGFTVTLYSTPQAKGDYSVMCIGV